MRGDVSEADGRPAFQEKSISATVADLGSVWRMSFRNGGSAMLGRSILASNIAASGEIM